MVRGHFHETGVLCSRAFVCSKFGTGEGFQPGNDTGLRSKIQRRLCIAEAKSSDDLRTSGQQEKQAIAVLGATSGSNGHNVAFHGHKFGRHYKDGRPVFGDFNDFLDQDYLEGMHYELWSVTIDPSHSPEA
jgi:hypothetical protein